jgi:hypothetical protein
MWEDCTHLESLGCFFGFQDPATESPVFSSMSPAVLMIVPTSVVMYLTALFNIPGNYISYVSVIARFHVGLRSDLMLPYIQIAQQMLSFWRRVASLE